MMGNTSETEMLMDKALSYMKGKASELYDRQRRSIYKAFIRIKI